MNFLLLLQQCTKISENSLFRFYVVQITWNEKRAWTKTNSSKTYFIITLGPSEKYHTNLYENSFPGFFLSLFVCHLLASLVFLFFFCFVFHHGFRPQLRSLDLLTMIFRFLLNGSKPYIKPGNRFPIASCWSSVDMIRFSFSFRQAMLGPNIMGGNKRWQRYNWKPKLTSFCSKSFLKGFPCTKAAFFF